MSEEDVSTESSFFPALVICCSWRNTRSKSRRGTWETPERLLMMKETAAVVLLESQGPQIRKTLPNQDLAKKAEKIFSYWRTCKPYRVHYKAIVYVGITDWYQVINSIHVIRTSAIRFWQFTLQVSYSLMLELMNNRC